MSPIATLCVPCWQAPTPTSREVGKAQLSQMGLGTRGLGVLAFHGCHSETTTGWYVLVPGGGRLCPMDISAGCGSQPVRNRAWPQGSPH